MTTPSRSAEEYRAFLLRLWCDEEQQAPAWRCSLEDTATRQRRGFEDIEALASYLRSAFAIALEDPPPRRKVRKLTSGAAPRAGDPGSSGCRG
jgi:hypothetical protein